MPGFWPIAIYVVYICVYIHSHPLFLRGFQYVTWGTPESKHTPVDHLLGEILGFQTGFQFSPVIMEHNYGTIMGLWSKYGWINWDNHGIIMWILGLSSGKHRQNEWERSTVLNGKMHELSMAIFNSYVKLPEGKHWPICENIIKHPWKKYDDAPVMFLICLTKQAPWHAGAMYPPVN